jgi:hypothetical protein
VYNRTIIFQCDSTSMRGLGEYQKNKRDVTVNRVLGALEYYSKKGIRLSIRSIHKITGINMITLRKTLTRLARNHVLREVNGLKNSKLYCIFELDDHIEYLNLLKEFPLGEAQAKKLFSKDFVEHEDGYMVRK